MSGQHAAESFPLMRSEHLWNNNTGKGKLAFCDFSLLFLLLTHLQASFTQKAKFQPNIPDISLPLFDEYKPVFYVFAV